jgi:hypothetical protein
MQMIYMRHEEDIFEVVLKFRGKFGTAVDRN